MAQPRPPRPAFLDDDAFATLVRLALDEDGVAHDLTARGLVPDDRFGIAEVRMKADGVVAGLPLLLPESPLMRAFPSVTAEFLVDEGATVRAGDIVARLRGKGRELLGLERTLLNFLQRMSGIATETARYVAAAEGGRARIMETRKTVPGHRALDKYAVRVGGGHNHRMGLHDAVLVKENHLAFAGDIRSPDAVRRAVGTLRASSPPGSPIEIEVETLEQFDAALAAGCDIVMLDDMDARDHVEAVRRRDAAGSPMQLEVSGGVTLDRVAAIAARGVDRISVGALTHSVRALDIALDIVPVP